MDWYAIGQIIKGDYLNKFIAKWSDTEWVIVPAPHFEQNSIWGTGWKYKNPNGFGKLTYTGPKEGELISENTVNHFEEIGSQATGPDGLSMIKGTLIGGLALGLAAGASSATTASYVAFYMNDGANFIVHFTNGSGWQQLKANLFDIGRTKEPTPQVSKQISEPTQKTTIPTLDAFEAIKKFKELLDLGIISQEEFDKKKNELLNSQTSTASSFPSKSKERYDVVLTSFGKDKIGVIKVIRNILNLGLADAKAFVESTPIVVKKGLTEAEARNICSMLESAGAIVEMQ